MNFVILNSLLFPVPRTHYLHIKKMAQGFAQLGYCVIETDTLESLISLKENDIVYISNHFYVDFYYRITRQIQLDYLKKILEKLVCKVLFWNFHTLETDFFYQNNNNWLFLTESFYDEHFKEDNLDFYSKVRFYQLQYSSAVNDLMDIELPQSFKFDFNYVGSRYNEYILKKIKNNISLKSYIKLTPPIINEIKRVNSFTLSKINLVFHSEENKRKGIITERFAEALSYGNIIFHDNKRINEKIPELQGCRYVKSYEEIIDNFHFFNELSAFEFNEIVNKNREYWRTSPYSYRKQALNIKNLY